MFECHMMCHARDLLDEGPAAVLDCLQGQLGVDGLTLVVLSDERPAQLRLHAAAEPRVQRCAGGLFVQADTERFAATRIAPPLAAEARKHDLLITASKQCAERGMDLRAAIQPLCSTRLAGRHGAFARKNIFGQTDAAALCFNNPDVRAYMTALAGHLSSYDGLSAVVIDLRDIAPRVQLSPHTPDSLSEWLQLCFCESCLQQAEALDIDCLAARRAAHVAVDKVCRAGVDPATIGDLDILQRYQGWWMNGLQHALREFQRACSKALVVIPPSTMPEMPDVDSVLREDAITSASTAADRPVEWLLQWTQHPQIDGPALVHQTAAAQDRGLQRWTISDYGAVGEWQFDWIRQALRHARRK